MNNTYEPQDTTVYTTDAVSYTHLDVYKRQVLLHLRQRRKGRHGQLCSLQRHPRRGSAHCVLPVSYTHLDVYKRQEHKVSLLMDHTRRPGDVADPWYTGDFEATWQDVLEGCTALLEELR